MHIREKISAILSGTLVFALLVSGLVAQGTSGESTAQGDQEQQSDQEQQGDQTRAVIKRQPVVLKDPRSYQIPLRLKPSRSIALTAPVDGVVRSVRVKAGDLLPVQGDAVRMDATRTELLVRRAKALVAARKIERKLAAAQAQDGDDKIALADAYLEAAKAELDLAQLDQERMVVRGPFAGTILQVYVVAGQFVRAGDPLVELADVTVLHADIPVDRAQVKPNTTINVTIENTTTKATVLEIRPPGRSFDPLRNLVDSLAAATIAVKNDNAKFQPGQAVYSEVIPEDPVVAVPSQAIANQQDGSRKVQVVRDYVIRDVTIEPLAQIGSQRIYVAGLFAPGDEVVVSSTMELRDGTQLVLRARENSGGEMKEKPAHRRATLGSGSSQRQKEGGKGRGF